MKVFDGRTGQVFRGFWGFDEPFRGGVNVAAADLDGDGFAEVVAAAGPGGGPHVRVFDGRTGNQGQNFWAYDPAFLGGLTVAVSEGRIVTGAGPGGGPHVRLFDPTSGDDVLNFFAYPASFVGGVSVAAGDVDGSGTTRVLTAATADGLPVKAFDGHTGAQTLERAGYVLGVPGGVRVAAAGR